MTVQFANFSDVDLLGKLIGIRESRRLYRGSLQPLFSSSVEGEPQEKCAVARELVKRWLGEELQRDCVLTQPSSVRDYLRVCFANQEHESFLVLYLDAQNRLIRSEELFRGTLTQTSVYPREVVKGALKDCYKRSNFNSVFSTNRHSHDFPEYFRKICWPVIVS